MELVGNADVVVATDLRTVTVQNVFAVRICGAVGRVAWIATGPEVESSLTGVLHLKFGPPVRTQLEANGGSHTLFDWQEKGVWISS